MKQENKPAADEHFMRSLSLLERNKKKRKAVIICAVLAVLVAFTTIFQMIKPAIAVVRGDKFLDCPYEVHTHDEDCYQAIYDEDGNEIGKELICGRADYVIHHHTEECYQTVYHEDEQVEEKILVCELPETEAHQHDDSCYDEEGNLTCEKLELHTHDESCYAEDHSLICGKTVLEEHIHNEDCFTDSDEFKKEPETTQIYPAQSFEETAGDLLISAEASEGTLPADAVMYVQEADTEEMLSVISSAVDGEITRTEAVEITFFDHEGTEIEPLQPLSISVVSSYESETETPHIVQLDEQGEVSLIENEIIKKDESEELVFETEANAVNVIVYTIKKETTISSDGHNYKISVTYGSDAGVPEEAELIAWEITEDSLEYQSYLEQTNQTLGIEEPDYVRLFDISILDQNGNKVEISAPVDMKVELADAENESLNVVHFGEEAEVLDTSATVSEEGYELSFETTGFSVYAIVGTTIEKNVLASDGHNYHITATYEAETGIPADAELEVSEVTEGIFAYGKSYEEYVAYTENALGWEAGSASYVRVFDIKIMDKDNPEVKYQPKDGTSVDIRIELADSESEKLNVVHFADESEKGDVVENSTAVAEEGQVVLFEAEGFSVYVVADKGPIRTYSFYSPDASGTYDKYYFLTDTGESVYQQKIKTVDGVTEELVIPQLPSIPGSTTSTFAGWYVYDPDTDTYADEPFDFSNIPEVTSEEEIILRAKFADFAYVIFHEQYNGSTQTWPVAETRRGEKTDGSTTIQISDVTVTYDDSEAEENSAPEMAFRGWSLTKVDVGAQIDINGDPVQLVNDPITISENTDLYPVFVPINWLTFSSGPTGSGATYVPPRYYYTDEGENSFPTPVRTGYTFDGWYTAEEGGTKIVNADGSLAINGTVGEFYVVNNELRISDDATLYGHWTEANTKYTVVVWRQKATDDANLADNAKTYDFAESFTLDAVTGSQVSVANTYKNLAGSGDYSGFHYGRCDDAKTVDGNGSTVLNVYYDRNVHTLSFLTSTTLSYRENNTNRTNTISTTAITNTGNIATLENNKKTISNVTISRYGNNTYAIKLGDSWYQITGNNAQRIWNATSITNPINVSITALYGSSIMSTFPGASDTTYRGYTWTDISAEKVYTFVLSTVENMPDADVVFLGASRGTAKTIYYYVEVDNAEESDGMVFNGKYYKLYKTVNHNYNYITYDEEYHPITGYIRDYSHASPVFVYSAQRGGYAADIGSGNINYLYYDRDTYNITFTDSYTNQNVTVNDTEVTPVPVKYDQSISNFIPDDPTSSRPGYRFTGWYADSACSTRVYFTEEEYNNSTAASKVLYNRMPAYNLQLFAGWETEWYLIEIDPNGGELTGTQSTWFWEPYNGDPIEEYNTTTRHYKESLNGTWYYAVKDRDYYGLTDEWDDAENTISDRLAYYTQDVSDPAADLSKKYERSQDAYRYAGWYEVHEDGSETLYAFGQPVMHTTKLRLHWKQLGTYYIRYDAGSGTLDDQDNNEDTFHTLDDSDYADHANIVVTRTAQAPEGMSFVGWKIRGGDGTVYYPGQTFEFQSLYAFEESVDGIEKEYLILDAVYSTIGSAVIIYDANGGTVDAETVDYGKPTDEGAHFETEADEVSATISGLLNNSEVTLSTGSGFTLEGAVFKGWNTEPDASGNHFDAGENYYVDKEEPVTLYAEWQVKVYFDKNNANADWGGDWNAVDADGNPIYTWDETRQQYYTYVYVNGTVDEPIYVPVSSQDDERFAYWSPVRYTDSGEVAYEYDFDTPITGELTLYGFWANAIQVPYHVVDASEETLAEVNDWKKDNQEYFVVNTGTEIPLGDSSDTEIYVNIPSGYEYAFACVSDSLENCSEENIITDVGYNTVTKRVSVTYADGTTDDLPSDKEIYLIYFEDPKELMIDYKLMNTDGSLTDVNISAAAPTSATAGTYDMTTDVTTPLAWAANENYKYYSFAIGDENATSGSQLHMISASSGADNSRPDLKIRNTWRGYQYSTDGGDTWVSYGYDPELYVVYYESEPTIVTIKEETIGTREDMDEEFEYDVVITTMTTTTTSQERRSRSWNPGWFGGGSWGNWGNYSNYGNPQSVSGTESVTSEFVLSNDELKDFTLFYTSNSTETVTPEDNTHISGQNTQYQYRTTTITTVTQTITVTQRPKDGFTTLNDGEDGDQVYVYTYTTTSSSEDQEVTYTNTRTKEDIELHIALAQNGGFIAHDDMRTEDETVYTVSIPSGDTVTLSETSPNGLFTGDTDTYRFAGIIYGREDDHGNITAYYTDVSSVSFKPLEDSEFLGVYMNDDPSKLVEEGYNIYYVYYAMPKIVYMKEGANGVLTTIDPIERNGILVTLNGDTVIQNAQLEVGTDAFIIDQSTGGAYRVPPDLDGDNPISLNYVKIAAGNAGSTNINTLDGVSNSQTMQLKVIDGQVKYSFDGDNWTAFSGNEPTVYVIYKEKGYDLTITKTVDGTAKDGEFDLTITSLAITESNYSISGYTVEQAGETVTVETITAIPASGDTPGIIALKVKHGSNITISALQRGSYTIAEPGLSGFEMTATVGGYTATVTDNATIFVLNADNTADITNKPSTVPVKILKVDQERQPLEGAEFSLTGNGINATGLVSANRTIKVIHDGEEVDVTEALVYENEALPIGTYTLTETGTPDGYYSVEDVTIDVQNTETGIVVTARIGEEEIQYPKIERDQETGEWKIEITNQSGFVLPSTGGPGTNWLYLLGTVLTALAGAGLVMRKKQRS